MSARWLVDEPAAADARRVRLVLVRHGESTWNAEGRIQGHLGSGLSERGRAQAADAAKRLHALHPRVAVVTSSDLPRVIETAAAYTAVTAAVVDHDRRLREIDNGAWSGRTTAEVATAHPEQIAAIRRGEDIPRGGGETFAQLRARVDVALRDLARRVAGRVARRAAGVDAPTEPTALVFTHGGPIRVAVATALRLPAGGHALLEPPGNCSVTELSALVGTDGETLATTLVGYNHDPLDPAGPRTAADDVAAAGAPAGAAGRRA
ncbi:histidine phosphatase family protein [Jiangella asiatica]|uniref:histidine phosphatase family protein n=1 Tax=Jiangella asiatica TaxID=2530372 RepID=UPI0013A5D4A0|nr:histidine phosphatase family protein [Jiangella asiatica]